MVTYGFFNSVEGDRKYDADQMSEYFEGLIGNGVYASVGNALAVEPDEGMNVRVLSGRGVINCKWLSNDAAVSLPITGSDPSYDRYTAVVMRLDVDNRLMELDTIDGTPAAEPVKPTLTQSELIYELCLAWVRVNAGDVSVEEANITDARPTEDCGWVTGLITQQDVSDLTSDIYDELHTYAAGDYCIKDNTLQKNIVPTNPPEVWDPTHWEATNVGDELTEIKSNLTDLTPVDISAKIDTTSIASVYYAYKIGHLVIFSVATKNLTKSANSNLGINFLDNETDLHPVGATYCILGAGGASQATANITVQIGISGKLTFVGSAGFSSQAYFISGIYYIA